MNCSKHKFDIFCWMEFFSNWVASRRCQKFEILAFFSPFKNLLCFLKLYNCCLFMGWVIDSFSSYKYEWCWVNILRKSQINGFKFIMNWLIFWAQKEWNFNLISKILKCKNFKIIKHFLRNFIISSFFKRITIVTDFIKNWAILIKTFYY